MPRATYRLQLHAGFDFEAAGRIVPYLSRLGISHVYASPIMTARPGSTHGYDIVDHASINPELGGREGFDAFVAELHRHRMGLVLDFVPNHMGIGAENAWWMDVLKWGRASPHAGYFDIDWNPPGRGLEGRVLLPVLGDHFGAVLERGELDVRLSPGTGAFSVHYFDNRFPLAPRDYPPILREAASRASGGAEELGSLGAELAEAVRARPAGRRRERVASLERRLADAVGRAEGREPVEAVLQELNGRPGDPRSFDALDRLLQRQAYRLAFWRVAAFEINYRRFFDIDDLAGLRMEDPALFEAGHGLVRSLIADGAVQGLRLDHVDGLRDPKGYLARLHALAEEAGKGAGVGEGSDGARGPRPWLLVEKILAPHERLREDWAVQGTTGYEFMAAVNGLFVDPAGESALDRAHVRFLEGAVEYGELVVETKRLIMRETLASELNVLANLFHRLARQSRLTRDHTLSGFRTALADVVAHFSVYRTYVRPRDGASPEDRREIEAAVGRARRRTRQPDTTIYDFIAEVLTLDVLGRARADYRRADVIDAALRFQQYTGPVMAKAVEDTAFYRHQRLVSLNEVGGEPDVFGTAPAALHHANRRRLDEHPFSLVATATHDHKRGEDARARLDVLSEVPREWTRRVRRWARMNRKLRGRVEGRRAPSPSDEYLFYQVLVGVWPHGLEPSDDEGLEALRGRVEAYMLKAAREAKARTSWVAPDEEYEEAMGAFVRRALDPGSGAFLADLRAFVATIAPTGAVNGLAQTLVKLASPGVPDTYQGTERWDLSLVDPDNRRPVDYDARVEALDSGAGWGELLEAWADGRVKQQVVRRVLEVRAERPELFARGAYRPVETTGRHDGRIFAFLREEGGAAVLAVVPRLVHPLMGDPAVPLPGGWADTAILLPEPGPGAPLEDLLTGAEQGVEAGGRLAVEAVLSRLPVALLLAGERRVR